MLAVAGIIAAAALMIVWEIPSLLRKKRKKELWAFSVLLALGTVLAIAQSRHLPIPNPVEWILIIFQPVAEQLKP